MNKNHSIWVERYRPTTISDVIFQDDKQQRYFENFVKKADIPNLLLSGIRGTGKTSVAQALINDLKIDPLDVIRINSSNEKIDAMRDKVSSFSMTLPIGKFKVVRLEELDYSSIQAHALLRDLMERVSQNCRFIATCNYENRIIPELRDRFQRFYFHAPDKEQIAVKTAEILEREKVDFDIDHLLTYIDVGYPSIRQIIQLLQQNSINGVLESPTSLKAIESDWKFGLLECLSKGDFKKARKLVCESATKEEHEDVYRFLYENESKLPVKDHDAAIIAIAEFLYRHSLVADTEINLAALFLTIGKL